MKPREDRDIVGEHLSENAETGILFERLSSIIRTVSKKDNVEIVRYLPSQDKMRLIAEGQDPETVWFRSTQHDPRTKEVIREFIYLPPEMFRIPENEAKGKAAHEAGHAAITRYGEFVPDEVASELGFSSMLAALEERPTDQVVRLTYPGAGQWVDEARLGSLREGEEMKRKMEGQTGKIPKFLQFNNTVVYGRFADKLTDIDDDVWKIYHQLKKEIETVESSVPDVSANESQRLNLAKERYKKAYLKIWPEIKKLVEQDRENEEMRQMLNRGLQKQMSQDQLEEAIENGNLEEKIKEALEQMMSQGGQSGTEQEGKKDGGKLSENGVIISQIRKKLGLKNKGALPEESESDSQGETSKQSPSDMDKLAEDMANQIKEKTGSGKQGDMDLPLSSDKIPELLKKALKKLLENLPSEAKKQVEKSTKKVLEQMEDESLQSMQSKLNEESNLPTHRETEKRIAEDELLKQQGKQREAVQKVMEEAERRSSAVRENQDVYDRTYAEVFEYEESLYRRLEEIFNPNLKKNVRLKSSGSRINLPAVYRRASQIGGGSPTVDNKVFETVHFPDKKDYAITLLVDLSGSMRNEKIRETFKGVVLLAEVLNRLGVKIEVLGFQDDVIEFKGFDEEMDNKIRKRMSGMIDEVEGSNPNGHNQPSYNDDAPCLQEASERISQRREKERFIFVMSDGLPAGRRSDKQDLTKAIAKIKDSGVVKLLGLGLGAGTEHVKRFYRDTALPNIKVRDLPHVLGELLTDIIQNPQKYA